MIDVRQSDLIREIGIAPSKMKKVRAKHLADDDWYKDGATIWIKPSGEWKLRVYAEAGNDAPERRGDIMPQCLPHNDSVMATSLPQACPGAYPHHRPQAARYPHYYQQDVGKSYRGVRSDDSP